MSSETFGIGSNVPCFSALEEERYSLNLFSDNLDIELAGENASSSGESDSDNDNETLTPESQETIINRAFTMANIASYSFSKEQSPLLASKYSWIYAPSTLLLFSHTDRNEQSQYLVAEKKLNEIVSNYGFEKMSVPDDGDCCFSSISFALDKMLECHDDAVQQHLQSLNIHRNQDLSNRNIVLRELVVAEWLGMNSEEYACFFNQF